MIAEMMVHSLYSRPSNSISNPYIHHLSLIYTSPTQLSPNYHPSISYYSDGSCDTVREYTLQATNLCLDLTKHGSSEEESEFRTCLAIGTLT